ncbi:peptide chain release factor N(5)-glutamine methyltransferase [Phorcysia thermohydrogeniphila]|uniref:Release factor glutamine methyltransferase n=1 Tax=Phorcysia thermohydrogeniphila TaxID=936138 RepID=A0A4R1GHV3_9BACT|nr:peptide chain release factor N(5)-glutamine methyltransferase [Phorcysia thermohydrogeniphila]TCK05439.1 release factor glutamine methyltransferase [Phorcysia thermohydrogeniphila]
MKWTVGTLVKRATEILKERGIKTARLDAELLLAHSLGFSDRVKLYTEFDRPLTEEEVESYRKLIVRRAKGEPVAYITGKKEFYGFTFRVERGVLIPRPETELLVDVVLDYLEGKEGKIIVDVGTGSGCIIITLCKLLKNKHRYIGTDISSIAIKVAEKNRRIHGCREVEFIKTDLLKGVEPPVDVVVSNPPYVPIGDRRLEESVRKFEPAVALFGGKDGLEVIRKLIPQAYEKLKSGGLIALEVGKGQAEAVKELLEASGFRDVKFHRDLSGKERVVSALK